MINLTQVKRKKKRKLTPVVKLICFAIIGLSFYLIYLSFNEFVTMIELKSDLTDVQEQLQQVQDENTYLTSQRDKLQDPDYVQSYARGNYMLTKEGENIYYLPGKDK